MATMLPVDPVLPNGEKSQHARNIVIPKTSRIICSFKGTYITEGRSQDAIACNQQATAHTCVQSVSHVVSSHVMVRICFIQDQCSECMLHQIHAFAGVANVAGNGTGGGVTDYSREALLTGLAHMAALMRASITDWRDPHGAGIKKCLKEVCSSRS